MVTDSFFFFGILIPLTFHLSVVIMYASSKKTAGIIGLFCETK